MIKQVCGLPTIVRSGLTIFDTDTSRPELQFFTTTTSSASCGTGSSRRTSERNGCVRLNNSRLLARVSATDPRCCCFQIMYDSFFKIESQTNTKAPQFFKASVFSKFAQDRLSAISSLSFFHYVVRKGTSAFFSNRAHCVCLLNLFVFCFVLCSSEAERPHRVSLLI